jgi:hypothetical protein
MKKLYKSLLYAAPGVLCLLLAMPASAQRPSGGGNGGGGGGSSRPASSGSSSSGSSSGSSTSSRPSGGNGNGGNAVGVSRPAPTFNQPRQSGGAQTVAPRGGGYGNAQRPGVNVAPRQYNTPRTYNAPRAAGYNYVPNGGASAVRPGNYGYAPRTGPVARPAYRTVPQIGYGHGGGYWGNHGYYHYNHGYYGSYYAPRLGFAVGVLPYGYFPFYWGDYQYFYSEGLYYQYNDNQYTVVEPPIGAEITTLPEKAQSIVINGQQYYELNGVYYQPVTKDDGTVVYQIAGKDGELNTGNGVQEDEPQGPQMGDIVAQLPPDCRKLKVNGEVLYVSPDGVYYQQLVDTAGNKTYKVVGLPSDEPDQN